jgi:hypothetical protein
MSENGEPGKLAALRRKLRALTAVARDPNATAAERANATSLKQRMQRRLDDAGTPAGDWTDNAFRLGRMAKEMKKTASPAEPKGDWTDHARGLGKAFRRGTKRFFRE